jgi:hypothetical protein
VTRPLGIKICLVLALLCAGAPAVCFDSSEECGGRRAEWLEAYHRLHDAVEEFQKAKEDPVGPRIEEKLVKRSHGVSTAMIVRRVLDARKTRMAEAREKAAKLLGVEEERFHKWRTCRSANRSSRFSSRNESAVIERKRLKSRLSDLFLDEAYAQYKDYRAPSSSSYSYRSRRWPQSGPYGYDPRGFYTQGRGYRGFYR